MTSETTPKRDRTGNPIRLPTFSTVLFFCALVTLVACLAWTITARRRLDRQIESLTVRRAELQHELDAFDELREQWSKDRTRVLAIFRQCREADDVPLLESEHIVSDINGDSAVAFYVPAGVHRLVIQASWSQSPADDQDVVIEPGESTWEVPLIGGQGYYFSLSESVARRSRSTRPYGWTLASTDKTFRPRSETLPLPGFYASGSSWSSHQVMRLPNTVSLRTAIGRAKNRMVTSSLPSPIRIGRWTKRGRVDDAPIEVRIETNIVSETDPVLTALDAHSLYLIGRDLTELEYIGGGRYRVIPDPNESNVEPD